MSDEQRDDTVPKEFLRLAEFAYTTNPPFRYAVSRVAANAVLAATTPAIGTRTCDSWRLSPDTMRKGLLGISKDLLVFGNSFVLVQPRFTRLLKCPHCANTEPGYLLIAEVARDFVFRAATNDWLLTCARCSTRASQHVLDRVDASEVLIKRFSPFEITIASACALADTPAPTYLWDIPESYRKAIELGDIPHILTAPLPLLDAIATGKWFQFAAGVLLHATMPSGDYELATRWAVPPGYHTDNPAVLTETAYWHGIAEYLVVGKVEPVLCHVLTACRAWLAGQLRTLAGAQSGSVRESDAKQENPGTDGES